MKLVLSSNQVLHETVASIIPSAGMSGRDFHFFEFGSLTTLSDAV